MWFAKAATMAYNLKNPAVKRILQEIKEVQADTSGDFIAAALEVRGVQGLRARVLVHGASRMRLMKVLHVQSYCLYRFREPAACGEAGHITSAWPDIFLLPFCHDISERYI